MNQNFSKSKILHEKSKWEHFQFGGGGVKFLGTILGAIKFGPLKSLGFQQLSHL